jgi:sugar phosphate permease
MGLGALLIGIGYGPITPASSHLLARTTPKHQMSLVFSLKQTGVPLGSLMAGAIVPPMLLGMSWHASLGMVAAVCVGCAALSQPLRAELDNDRQADLPMRWGSWKQPIRLVLAHRTLSTMAACSFMFSMVQLSLTTYLVTFLHDDLAYGLIAAGLALSLTQLGGMAGRIAWGYVADRWLGARRVLLLLAGLMALGALATTTLSHDTPQWAVIFILVTFGASAIGWNGVYMAEVARISPPGMIASTTGASLFFTYLGGIVCPSGFAYVIMATASYQTGVIIFGLLSLLASLSLVLNRNKH